MYGISVFFTEIVFYTSSTLLDVYNNYKQIKQQKCKIHYEVNGSQATPKYIEGRMFNISGLHECIILTLVVLSFMSLSLRFIHMNSRISIKS